MKGIPLRTLGRTGIALPVLGLGAMDTPQSDEGAATLHAALDAGIRFIDTARGYEGSEILIGQVLRERGGAGDAFVASKTFSHSADGAQYDVDRSLKVLGLTSIPLYQLHDVRTLDDWADVTQETGALAGLQVARYRRLIDYIGISTHSLEVARVAIESGEFDTIMLEYSAFYPESAELVELAASRGTAVIAMRPLGGSGRTTTMRGRLSDGTAGILTPANLLRYVLSNPSIAVAIPGARFSSRIHENVATAGCFTALSPEEQRLLEEAAAALY